MRFRLPSIRRSSAPPQAAQRVYAIGDIHGRFDLLSRLILAIESDSAERGPAVTEIVVLGDFIDRGPGSAEVIAALAGLREREGLVVLKGNHEAALVEAWHGDRTMLALWLDHGGDATLRSLGASNEEIDPADQRLLLRNVRKHVSKSLVKWLASLPIQHRWGAYLFVHAGIRPGLPLAQQSPQDMLWIREEFTRSDADHGLIVVHGHTISDQACIRRNRIGIDTGAYRTGRLTAIGLEAGAHWVVEASSDE
ncbi:MAG: metallophosphoesterase family protein [Novosphingobium sp.]